MSELGDPKESLTTVPRAFLFDVDGVLTNRNLEVNPEVVSEIARLASSNMPVALLTGRSDSFILENIVPTLKASVSNQIVLENIYVVAEFGAVHVRFRDGQEIVETEKELSLPGPIKERALEVGQKFSTSMWIESKRTMFTIVSNKDYPQDKFREDQDLLALELDKVLEEVDLEEKFEVHKDSSATNIRSKNSNKRHATRVILDWIKSRGVKPLTYVAFGDSISDKEIKDELDGQGLPNKFVFVGRDQLDGPEDQNVVYTNAKLDQGTLEYLKSLR